MDKELKQKISALQEYFANLKSVIIAFSGGVDSSFLLHTAHKVLNNQVKAVTINTVYIPERELKEAEQFTQIHNISHEIINIPLIDIIKHNPNDRCYFCKTFIFKKLQEIAKHENLLNVAEGTNADDQHVYRPGSKALKELGILSPLKDTGFTKQDIRKASQYLKLPTWNKPAYACLLTRLPYGSEINEKKLNQIEQAEDYLISLGFDGARVRTHDKLARIEVFPEHMEKILNRKLLLSISDKLKQFGFEFVTLDASGYKTGSFDYTT